MWQLEPTTQWERDKKWYEKKRPDELAGVLYNLKRYIHQLNAAPNPKAIMAGYIHPEPMGVVALAIGVFGPKVKDLSLEEISR